MASAVDSRLAYARLSAVATASRLPTANRGSNNSYTTSWDTTANQPKITKRARQLIAQGYLRAQPGTSDRRVKQLSITGSGRAAFRAAGARLAPELERIFADWDAGDVERLNTLLFRLKTWLDQNRNDHRPPPASAPADAIE